MSISVGIADYVFGVVAVCAFMSVAVAVYLYKSVAAVSVDISLCVFCLCLCVTCVADCVSAGITVCLLE